MVSSHLPLRRWLAVMLVCLVLLYSMIPPVRADPVTASVVGVSAVLLVASILVALGIEPLVNTALSGFNQLVNDIVAALPAEFFAVTAVSGTFLKIIFRDGISYAPRSLVEWISNYLLSPVSLDTAEDLDYSDYVFPTVMKSFSPTEVSGCTYSDFYDYTVSASMASGAYYACLLNTMEFCSLLRFSVVDPSDNSSYTSYGYIWYNVFPTFEITTDQMINGTVYDYAMKVSSENPFVLTLSTNTGSGFQKIAFDPTYSESTYFSNYKKAALYQNNKAVALTGVSSVDSLTVSDDYALSLTDAAYATWIAQGVTITNDLIGTGVVSVPISVADTISGVVDRTLADTRSGTLTIADTVAIATDVAVPGSFNFDEYTTPTLRNFFPFCIPFDLYAMMRALCADPTPPVFTFATSFLGHVYEVEIDLSAWNGVAQTIRYMIVALYVVALAVSTRKFIKW